MVNIILQAYYIFVENSTLYCVILLKCVTVSGLEYEPNNINASSKIRGAMKNVIGGWRVPIV